MKDIENMENNVNRTIPVNKANRACDSHEQHAFTLI